MKRHQVTIIAAVAALSIALSAPAFARDGVSNTSELALASTAMADFTPSQRGSQGKPDDAPMVLAVTHASRMPGVDFAGVHYRPRGSRGSRNNWGRPMDSQAVTQIHLGFFDPDGDLGSRFLVGVRGGPKLDPHVQIGLGVDWAHKSENTSTVTTTQIGPGGVPIQVKSDLARSSTNMFPIMGFIQLSADDDLPIIPYFGAAGGYEVLVLSGDDFTTGQSFDGTFGGWGWQLWGGAAMPLGGRTRMTGELFVNGAELTRDVTDDFSGNTYRESVDGNGMGMRIGLAWGF